MMTSDQSDRTNTPDRFEGMLSAGSDIAGAAVGSVLGFFAAGPAGAAAGGARGAAAAHTLRKNITALPQTDWMRMITAIDDLDQKMDADPTRNWKQRRLAFMEIIECHRDQRLRPEQSRESPTHIFKTSIKTICERSGLKSFYDNVLVPLVSRMAEALRLKPTRPSSKPEPDSAPRSSGSDFDMS